MKFPTLHTLKLSSSILILAGWPLSTATANEPAAVVIQADFGGAVMPGVVYSISKELDVFNVQPLIPLYDIEAASRRLAYTAPYWPSATVFVSVVDPGVGTTRKSVVLKTKSGHFFVTPDNGTLTDVAAKLGIEALREIDESVNRIKGSELSHTFHGRDVYSYTAGRLAAGVISYEEVGPLLEPAVVTLERPACYVENNAAFGYISSAQGRLGNVASNIRNTLFNELGMEEGELVLVTIRQFGKKIWEGEIPYVRTFGEVPMGDPLLFVNSSYYMSVALNQGQFGHVHNIGSGPNWTMRIQALTPVDN